jgi:chromosome segregation ATPase
MAVGEGRDNRIAQLKLVQDALGANRATLFGRLSDIDEDIKAISLTLGANNTKVRNLSDQIRSAQGNAKALNNAYLGSESKIPPGVRAELDRFAKEVDQLNRLVVELEKANGYLTKLQATAKADREIVTENIAATETEQEEISRKITDLHGF